MKIAVLGANGFIGHNIQKNLSSTHTVVSVTRDTINSLNPIAVKEFLTKWKFDVIVNCAAVMTDPNSLNDAYNNLGIFMNFYNNADLFGKFINTASGAEFDRNITVDNALESSIFDCMPTDSYGWGQNIKARLCARTPNFYNIRIFNCFGKGELNTRIFPRFLSDKNMNITNDRYFDYFSIQDLIKVINHCINNNWPINDVNAVYAQKYKISEVLAKFCNLNHLSPSFNIVSESSNKYTGSATLINSLNINLDGLENGLLTYKEHYGCV